MGCAFRLRRVGETVSRFRAIFRVALSATNPIRKPRLGIRPKTGPHFPEHSMQRWTKGTGSYAPRSVPNCRQKRSVPKCRPNDYHGNAAGRGRTAKTPLSEQGDVKRKGADLLVAPLKLNVRLPLRGVCSVEQLRRLVKRRNSPSSSWHSSSRWLRNRRQTTRRRHCRST